mmetsp:Transcript_3477/g.8509  ORF Transcript_3477/g.8509 Transcript_3477/m.8509 type:complete len:627 (-) Transcript_3477:41-1921(-)
MELSFNIDQDHDQGDHFAPVNINIELPPSRHSRKSFANALSSRDPALAGCAAGDDIMCKAFHQQQLKHNIHQSLKENVVPARTQDLAEISPYSLARPAMLSMDQIENMDVKELSSLKVGLKAAEQDARDSAETMRGVDRARMLKREYETVKDTLRNYPSIMNHKLDDLAIKIQKREKTIKGLQQSLEHEKNLLDATKQKKAAAWSSDKAEKAKEEKLELQKAVADSLADVLGHDAPQVKTLHSQIRTNTAKEIVHLQSKVASIEQKIAEQKSLLKEENEEKNKVIKQLREFRQERRSPHALSSLHPRRETMLAQSSGSLNLNPVEFNSNTLRHAAVNTIQDTANLVSNSSDTPSAYLTTVDPVNGAHTVATPDKVNTLATSTPAEEGPKVQWCQWGTQLVPCSPGYGGAWTEHHPTDTGIWSEAPPPPPGPKIREHVQAGRRSQPYVKDMFSYGQAGIFGARKPTRGLRRIAGGSILAAKETASGRPAAAAQVEQKEKAAAPAVAKRTSLSGGADGWISEEAKNAAAVYGIVNPSEEDKMLSKEELEKKFANVIETPGKEKDADGWVNEGAKNAAAMYGIVNPSIVDELTDPSMKSEQFQKKQMMLNELKRKELDRLKRLAHVSLV